MAQGPASAAVDSLVNAAYHRAILLAFEPDDVGIGWSGNKTANVRTPLVIDVTMPGMDPVRGLGQSSQPAIHGTALWPIDGAREVPIRLGLETPNPVPTQDVLTLGTPVSITVDASRTIHASQFTLTNAATGAVVPIQLLTNKSDTNFLIPESFIAAIPLVPLSASTAYRANFSGNTVQFPSGTVEAVSRTWSFTTAAQ